MVDNSVVQIIFDNCLDIVEIIRTITAIFEIIAKNILILRFVK